MNFDIKHRFYPLNQYFPSHNHAILYFYSAVIVNVLHCLKNNY